ncbi:MULTISPECIES: hypothetical protein [unclassified Bradyrhizobium]|uniref:hypothetical protein n=1 Tax=Bradyrhizobium sp. USDA 4541 TaxID=2817704 RepID=UPI0020A58D31|nr:hypothetical protein [Bradyrhizobium sp. USDA 4541]MCP1854815.1 hypothetical protein [Bradyrhizobium sp. USDA 4541]
MSVIASGAKQSIFRHMRDDGLLRRFSAKLLRNFVAELLAMTIVSIGPHYAWKNGFRVQPCGLPSDAQLRIGE